MRTRSQRSWGPSAAPRLARGSVAPRELGTEWITAAVRSRFPKLAAALGDRSFELLFAAFAASEPEARRSLATSTRLPEFLAATPAFPVWYGELALLDRAHTTVLHAPAVKPLARRDLVNDTELRLVPAHAIVHLTTTVDELWCVLDDAAAEQKKARASLPRALDWPRTVLIWRTAGEVRDRTIDHDEGAALKAALRGTSLVELSAGLSHARALDFVLRWVDDGVLVG